MIKTLFASAALALAGASAQASTMDVTPLYYDMQNGEAGGFEYWDESYGGPSAMGDPFASLSALTGGSGDLTDGVIATQSWRAVEGPAGPGPYVGWRFVDPEISFVFDKAYDFVSVTFHFDDSNGDGGVSPPLRVDVADVIGAAVPDPIDGAPFAFSVDITGYTGDVIDVQIFRRNAWVFLSEVEFEVVAAPAIPLPAGLPLLAGGLGALALLRKRRG